MFACLECGREFKTVEAAEKAAFGDKGCPKCGGSDIDLAPFTPTARMRSRADRRFFERRAAGTMTF